MGGKKKTGEADPDAPTAPEARDPTGVAGAGSETPTLDSVGAAHTITRSDPERALEGSVSELLVLERYEQRGELGRGGQSVVMRAFDTQLEREVALKELRADASEAERERFLREARITARLEHPNIVPVYEIGRRPDGMLYTVQKLVRADAADGTTRTLRRALQEAKTLDDRLRLLPQFLGLCQGIAYAHAQGVLHRDIKPENVVLGLFGETVILDWGLARARRDAARPQVTSAPEGMATVAGRAYGTPAYMSPEQAEGETVTLDARSDVWSLGAVLFELLTGRPPFTGQGAMEVVELVRTAPVPEALGLEPKAPPELAAVAMRALARDRALRYPSAQALADEVLAWQSNRPVSVYAYSAFGLARLFFTRHRAVATVAVAAFVAVATLAGVAWARYVAAREAVAHALVERARTADRSLRWNEAALLYAAARVSDDNPETQWGVRISGARRVPAPLRLAGHSQGVRGVAFSPDGARVATAAAGGKVLLFRTDTGAPDGSPLDAHRGDATSVAFTRDGRQLVTTGADGYARLWDLATRRKLADLVSESEPVNRVALAPDGDTAAFALEQAAVVLVSLSGARAPLRVTAGSGAHPVYGVALDPAPGRARLAMVMWDGRLELRGLDGALLQTLVEPAVQLQDVKYSPDGKWLAVAGSDKLVRLYEVAPDGSVDRGASRGLEGHEGKVYALEFSSDSLLLLSASTDHTVRVWDVNGKVARVGASLGLSDEVQALALSPRKQIAVGTPGADAMLFGWRAETTALAGGARIEALQTGRGGLLAVGGSGVVGLLDPERLTPVVQSSTQKKVAREVALSRDGSQLAWTDWDQAVYLADAATLAIEERFPYHLNPVPAGQRPNRLMGVAIAPDGSWVAASDGLGEARVFRRTGGEPLKLLGHAKVIFGLDASPDGEVLATGSYDRSVRLWNVTTGAELKRLEGHAHGVRRVRFSPDGRTLASGGWDRKVMLWDVVTGRARRSCIGHEDHVFGLDWSPDGRWLASGGRDGRLRIWDASDPEACHPLASFAADEPQVFSLAVWPDGRGLDYAGLSVHAFAFGALENPRAQLAAMEALTRQRVRGVVLEPLDGP